MKILKLTKINTQTVLEVAIQTLQNGGIVIYPTETCYGVGVDATNKHAVRKLLEFKDRPEGKAISIAVCSKKMAETYVELNDTAENLYKNFLPGPLTIISNSRNKVAKELEAEDNSLGVRIPDYPFTLELIKSFGKPITATSANASGRKTPYSVSDILNYTTNKRKDLISLIIDAGTLPRNPPSTVVDTRLNEEKIIRKGKINIAHLFHGSIVGTNKQYNSRSEEETKNIAGNLINELKHQLHDKCIIFALQGELGAGKTQFAKGVGRGLGIKELIQSLTFVLVREYSYNIAPLLHGSIVVKNNETMKQFNNRFLFHIDTWRMQEGKELLELGFEKMLKSGNVIVIEWLEKVKPLLESVQNRKDVLVVWIAINGKGEMRKIQVYTF